MKKNFWLMSVAFFLFSCQEDKNLFIDSSEQTAHMRLVRITDASEVVPVGETISHIENRQDLSIQFSSIDTYNSILEKLKNMNSIQRIEFIE